MKIAVLSGKGGAGKTLTAVNLAVSADKAAYIDCDVEEPNGYLFLKPEDTVQKQVNTKIPAFDETKCKGCRECVSFCRFNALVYIRNKPVVFPEVCHACGGCGLICPNGAVSETETPIGYIEQGRHGNVSVTTGVLNPGEASGVQVINAALAEGTAYDGLTVIDCPPGSSCAVMESISEADYCVLIAEPTAFGFHNFRMAYELTALLGRPCGVVINKMNGNYEPLESFCEEKKLPVLLRIPYSAKIAELAARGDIAAEEDGEFASVFAELLEKIGGAVK